MKVKDEILDRFWKEEVENVIKPRMKRLVGTCYAERQKGKGNNSFIRILSWEVTKMEFFVFIYEEMTIENDGQVCIRLRRVYDDTKNGSPFPGYKEISSNDYLDVRAKMMYELTTQGTMRKMLTGSKKRKNV